jgi:hypothetical protein
MHPDINKINMRCILKCATVRVGQYATVKRYNADALGLALCKVKAAVIHNGCVAFVCGWRAEPTVMQYDNG